MNRSDGRFPVQVEKKAMGLDHVPVMLSLGFCSLGAIGASERGVQTIPRKKGTKEAFCHPENMRVVTMFLPEKQALCPALLPFQ